MNKDLLLSNVSLAIFKIRSYRLSLVETIKGGFSSELNKLIETHKTKGGLIKEIKKETHPYPDGLVELFSEKLKISGFFSKIKNSSSNLNDSDVELLVETFKLFLLGNKSTPSKIKVTTESFVDKIVKEPTVVNKEGYIEGFVAEFNHLDWKEMCENGIYIINVLGDLHDALNDFSVKLNNNDPIKIENIRKKCVFHDKRNNYNHSSFNESDWIYYYYWYNTVFLNDISENELDMIANSGYYDIPTLENFIEERAKSVINYDSEVEKDAHRDNNDSLDGDNLNSEHYIGPAGFSAVVGAEVLGLSENSDNASNSLGNFS